MKKLTKTILTATLFFGLPLGAYAATTASETINIDNQANYHNKMWKTHQGTSHSKMWGNHQGGNHSKMGNARQGHNLTTEPNQNYQQKYDLIEDPTQKAEFIKTIALQADDMSKQAEMLKQFAEENQ